MAAYYKFDHCQYISLALIQKLGHSDVSYLKRNTNGNNAFEKDRSTEKQKAIVDPSLTRIFGFGRIEKACGQSFTFHQQWCPSFLWLAVDFICCLRQIFWKQIVCFKIGIVWRS